MKPSSLPKDAEALRAPVLVETGPSGDRLDYIDNVRTVLLLCVVTVHASIPYQYDTKLWYLDAPEQLGAATAIFSEICFTFVMPGFFFISGYFSFTSLKRKGTGSFMRDRLRRLGLPLIVLSITLLPPILYARHLAFRDEPISFLTYYVRYFLGLGGSPKGWSEPRWPDFQFAHLWYIEQILVLSAILFIAYSMKTLKAQKVLKPIPPPGILTITAYAILIGTILWIQRQYWPAQHWFALFGFIQTSTTNLAICPPMFLFGFLASRHGWLQRIPILTGWVAFAAATALIILRSILAASGVEFSPFVNSSLSRCLWEATVGTWLTVAILTLGRRWLDVSFPASRAVARAGYGIYLLHLPVVVAMQWALLIAPVSGLVKMTIVLLVGFGTSYLITTALLSKFPHLQRIV